MRVELLSLPDRLILVIDLFLRTMAPEACARRIGALSVAIWNRARTLERRFLALHALWQAGLAPRTRRRAAACTSARARRAGALPRRLRWMQGMLPLSAGTLAYGVEALLRDYPQTRTFVAEMPQAGRVLRPLCRMAGLPAPDWLALPKRVRGSSPRPSPGEGDARGRRRTAREVAKAAIERSARTGKPVDPRTIGAVAYGYVLHWPRDGNCPPPEVGYGGRTFTPLPKDYVRPKDDQT